jgi:hypothetical protein
MLRTDSKQFLAEHQDADAMSVDSDGMSIALVT